MKEEQLEFENSVRNNDFSLAKKLITNKYVNPILNDNIVILLATLNQNYDIVKLLLEDGRVSPTVNESQVAKICCEHGNLDILKLFINDKRVRLDEFDFISACSHGHLIIVNELLKHNNIEYFYKDNLAIQIAFKYKKYEIVEFLFSHNSVKNLLKKENIELYQQIYLKEKLQKF
jgi:ankyrin repeat protein